MKILGYEYTIDVSKPKLELGKYGSANMNTGVISIASDLCLQQKHSTLLHEILEIIDMQLQLGLSESAIIGFETGLYGTLGGLNVNWDDVYAHAKGWDG